MSTGYDNPVYENEKDASYKYRDSSTVSFKQQGFWQRRTPLEKGLLVLLALTLVALVAVVVLLAIEHQGSSNSDLDIGSSQSAGQQRDGICTTRDCVTTAAMLSNSIDYDVEPCQDFYKFACGRWMEEHVIPEDKRSYSTFTMLIDKVAIILKNILEHDIQSDDIESVKKAKVLYTSCMNTSAIDAREGEPLHKLLSDNTDGWPLTDADWKESDFSLEDSLLTLNAMGFTYPIIVMGVGSDNKNSTRRRIVVDQCSFGMPGHKYFLVPRDDKNLMAYENYIYNIAELVGFANPNTARQEVKEIVDFEIELANITIPDEERRDSNKLYNPMTLRELHGNYSHYFDWRYYINASATYDDIGVSDVTDDEIIINQAPEFFTRLGEVLDRTPNRTIANYIIWRLVQSVVGNLGEKFKEPQLKYSKVLWGTSTEQARFRDCTSYVTGSLGLAVGKMFIQGNFQPDAKTMALEMIETLQESFNNQLDQLDWMDEHTKVVAKEKNEYISPKIGYPEEVTNSTYLDELYANHTYKEALFFENDISNRMQRFKRSWRYLRQVVDKEKWDSPPSTVNAFYSPRKNQIMFPAGILQPPFFSQTYPKSMNYGGIGVVIGHEITHGFDDMGRQNDKYGNLVPWWSQEAIDKFKDKVQCIVNQYGNFTVAEIDTNLNGINTQGENLADNGGLKQSFDAYRTWVKKQGKEEPSLPGVDFTHNQLFFINFAQLWCNLMRPGYALRAVRTGVHSPGRFRVIGSLQNSDDFAQAFKCPADSYMNPPKKCRVW